MPYHSTPLHSTPLHSTPLHPTSPRTALNHPLTHHLSSTTLSGTASSDKPSTHTSPLFRYSPITHHPLTHYLSSTTLSGTTSSDIVQLKLGVADKRGFTSRQNQTDRVTPGPPNTTVSGESSNGNNKIDPGKSSVVEELGTVFIPCALLRWLGSASNADNPARVLSFPGNEIIDSLTENKAVICSLCLQGISSYPQCILSVGFQFSSPINLTTYSITPPFHQLTLTLSHTHSLSHTHTFTHTHPLSLTHTLSLTLSHILSQTHSLSLLSLFLSHTHSLTHSFSRTLTLSLSLYRLQAGFRTRTHSQLMLMQPPNRPNGLHGR